MADGEKIRKIARVGTGTIGSDVSLLYAMSGYSVAMFGRSEGG